MNYSTENRSYLIFLPYFSLPPERGACLFQRLQSFLGHRSLEAGRPRNLQPHHHDLQPGKTATDLSFIPARPVSASQSRAVWSLSFPNRDKIQGHVEAMQGHMITVFHDALSYPPASPLQSEGQGGGVRHLTSGSWEVSQILAYDEMAQSV